VFYHRFKQLGRTKQTRRDRSLMRRINVCTMLVMLFYGANV